MKQVFIILMAAVVLAGCKALTAAEKAELAQKVITALDEKHYTIEMQTMMPKVGPTKALTSDWTLEVRNDSLFSYLPYVGRAFSVPYGGGEGLNFMVPISSYKENMEKNGVRRIEIGVKNNEDFYTYRVEVFDNGSSFVDIQAQQRDGISFDGRMVIE